MDFLTQNWGKLAGLDLLLCKISLLFSGLLAVRLLVSFKILSAARLY